MYPPVADVWWISSFHAIWNNLTKTSASKAKGRQSAPICIRTESLVPQNLA